ncbi:MAG: hypothetical protein ACAI44_38725, partial [Candidatus Sericytochromatia bacterium]
MIMKNKLSDIYSILMAPLLRAFLLMLGTTTGVWIRFEKVRGDLFSYRVCLEGMDLKISNYLRCYADRCSIEFSILDFSLDMLIVSNVCVEGVRFEYNHVSDQDVIPRSLPPFLIRQLQLKDAVVVFTDHSRGTPYSFNIHLQDYQCEALHSQWLLFNAIFTSCMSGQLEDSALSIQYTEQGEKCISQWGIRGLPIKQVSHFVDGKLDLLEQSAFDLLVTNEWLMEKDEITMSVQVWLIDLVNFRLPTLLPTTSNALADAMSVLINHQVKSIPLAFQFKVKKGDFMELTNIDAAGILTA